MKKLLCLLILLTAFVLLFVSCGGGNDTTAPDSTDTEPIETTEALDSTEETTATVTTASVEEAIANNVYANAALELTLKVCEQYYDLRTHMLATSLTNRGATTIWPFASFVEMLAEAYRMYPENETIKKYYTDVMDKGLRYYLVQDATITPPSGEVYTGITYYNAGRGTKGDFYYDDNAWVCIQLLDAYQQLGDEKYLTYAEKLLEFFWTGYDERAGGGIYWSKAFDNSSGKYGDGLHYKGGCTNCPIGVCYAAAYKITGNELYLERAKMQYEWITKVIRDNSGIVHEGTTTYDITSYDPAKVSNWTPAYDQGTYMTLAGLLYEITGDVTYQNNLKKTAISSRSLLFNANNMNRNPIFKSWCIGWIVRGEMVASVNDIKSPVANFMRQLDIVLQKTLTTKDENGHYDPYFCAPGNDFWSQDIGYFDNDVIQPTGVATVLFLMARYQIFLAN